MFRRELPFEINTQSLVEGVDPAVPLPEVRGLDLPIRELFRVEMAVMDSAFPHLSWERKSELALDHLGITEEDLK